MSLLQDPLLNPHLFSFNMKRFDAKGAINGKQNDKKRMKYHIIWIGHESDNSPPNIGKQIKYGFTTPPHIQSISSLQRHFKNSVSRMITDTMVNYQDVYKNLANRGDGYTSGSDDESDLESDDEEDAEEEATDIDVTSKRKRARVIPQLPAPISPVKLSKYHLVEAAIGTTAKEIFENPPQHKHDMNRLCCQANSIMQEINQDNVVLNYKIWVMAKTCTL